MYTLPSPDYLYLAYRADLDILVLRWMRQPTEVEMQQGYTLALNVAAERQCRHWLVDARRRDHSNKDSSHWMMDSFFPQLYPRLGGTAYLAFVFAPMHLQELEADSAIPPLAYFEGRPYRVERFTEEHAANAWLNACRAPQNTSVLG